MCHTWGIMHVFILASITADGFIGRDDQHTSLDWTSPEDKRHFVATTKAAGVMVMGSKTFATIGRGLPGRKTYVYTSQPDKLHGMEGVEPVSIPPAELLQKLQTEGYEQVAVCGGASIYSLFLEAGVVDELVLTVEPLVFGKGLSLLAQRTDVRLRLTASQPLNDNTLLLRYAVSR